MSCRLVDRSIHCPQVFSPGSAPLSGCSGISAGYGLSYYPVLNRYKGIRSGKITSVPFVNDCGSGDFCLFYSKRACHQRPKLQTLVDEIQASAREFLAEVEGL